MKEKPITIRPSTNDDLTSLAELRWCLCTDDAEVENPEEKKRFIKRFCLQVKKLQKMGNLRHFIADDQGDVIGVISLFLVNKIPSPDDINGSWGYITNVYVKPEHRDRGIGSKLLQFVKNYSEANGDELLVVWPSDRSYPFYMREGFKSAGREQDPLVLVLKD